MIACLVWIFLVALLVVFSAGCASQRSQQQGIEQEKAEIVAILTVVYGDDSDFRLARAIESRIQRIEYEKRTK